MSDDMDLRLKKLAPYFTEQPTTAPAAREWWIYPEGSHTSREAFVANVYNKWSGTGESTHVIEYSAYESAVQRADEYEAMAEGLVRERDELREQTLKWYNANKPLCDVLKERDALALQVEEYRKALQQISIAGSEKYENTPEQCPRDHLAMIVHTTRAIAGLALLEPTTAGEKE